MKCIYVRFLCRLLRNLSLSNPASVLYKAAFCVWLLTYNAAFINPICDKGIVKAVCDVIKESRVEKVRFYTLLHVSCLGKTAA